MAMTLGAVAEGSIVYLNESGVAVPFYVAKHDYESGLNGAGRTLLVRKDCYHTIAVNGDGTATNTYADKTYDTWLNGTYKALLDSFVQTAMATTTFYYTVGGGGAAATTLTRSIFGLSLTEFGLSSSSFNVEGSALPIADTLKIAYLDGTAVIQNTRSAGPNSTSTMGYVSATGTVYVDMHAANKRGSRPCFTLPSTQGVDSSNNIIDGTGDTTPETYTKLEYITSSGTQYIDTGFKPNNNTRAVADVSISSSKTTQALFGGRTSANTTSGAMFAVFTTNTTTIRSDYNGAYTQSLNCPRDTRVTIDKNKETTSVNGNSASYTNASFQSAATLTIFALNENGTIESGTIGVMTLYSFKLYDNNTLVRDFIPARRNSDGAVGLLDQANNVFYGNAGTGTFTAGPEIASTGSLANVAGTSVLLTGCLANVGGIEYAIPYALANVDGIEVMIPFGEQVSGTPVGDFDVGETVWMNVNGTPYEWIIVHQGLPSSLYDSSCDGTWLLMKNLYKNNVWDGSNNDYENSDIHVYLNDTFAGMLDAEIQSILKQIKIPYRPGAGTNRTISSGSNGLTTSVFILSGAEMNWTTSTGSFIVGDGTCLSYFSGCAATDSKRVASLNGANTVWWTRSPYAYLTAGTTGVLNVTSSGGTQRSSCQGTLGVRPALVLPSDALVGEDGFILPA